MQYSEILNSVKAEAGINDDAQAEKAIQATLETLKKRIIGDEASNLAAQLPEEIGQYLRGREGENGEHFSLEEFYQKVAETESVDQSAASAHVRGVFSALSAAVSSGEMDKIKNDLSEDYGELFAVGAA